MVFMATFRVGSVIFLVIQCLSIFLLLRTMSSSTETNFRRNPKDHQIHDSHPSYDVQNQHESENSPEQSEVADIVDEIPEAEIHQPLIRGFYEGEVLSYHLFTVESSPRMKMDFVVLLQDFLVERTNYLTTMELLKSSKPITKDMYSYVPYESPEDRKISKYVRSVEDKASQNTYKLRSSNTSTSLQKLAQKLLLKLTKPVKRCKKMVKIGGRSMNKMPDGEKYMCMDPDTKLNAKSCLVYAFGIGYDFSFERMMSIFGCRVMAFDDDEAHSKLTSTPFNRVTFIGVRLSLSDKVEVTRMTELKRDGRKSTYSYLYRPLDNILSIAGHEDAILDYLKMDIEGSEWSAFETSIFKSGVLRRTRYLAVEVHLDALINTNLKNSSLLSIQLLRYLRFFNALESRGLQLLHYEPNFVKPNFKNIFGIFIPVFAELVWWNPKAIRGTEPLKSTKQNLQSILAKLEDTT